MIYVPVTRQILMFPREEAVVINDTTKACSIAFRKSNVTTVTN